MADACSYNASGPAMVKDFPEVVDQAHIRLREQCTLSYGTHRFLEPRVGVASDRFLTLFTFPLLQGDPATALTQPNTVVLSETTARKYFGAEDPIGKIIGFHDGYYQEILQVTGVMKDVPANAHLQADVLVSYTTTQDWGGSWAYGWGGNNDFVYVLLAEQADPASLTAK